MVGAGWALEASGVGGTHQKNVTFERKNKKKNGEASPGEAEPCGARGRSPHMAWGPPAPWRCPVVKCSGPVPLHRPGRSRRWARAAGQTGQGTRGRTAAFSTHTLCNITATTSVRPPRGEARPTHPHAGPARPSDTGETRDEVGGDTRLLVNHVGGAPRRVRVQQAVHGAKPAEERSDAEHGVEVAPQHPGLGRTGPPPPHRITESQQGRGWKGPLWVI